MQEGYHEYFKIITRFSTECGLIACKTNLQCMKFVGFYIWIGMDGFLRAVDGYSSALQGINFGVPQRRVLAAI